MFIPDDTGGSDGMALPLIYTFQARIKQQSLTLNPNQIRSTSSQVQLDHRKDFEGETRL